jgi:hypothetical protein
VVNAKARAYDDPIIEGERVYARFPHFRDGAGIPDSDFDITSELKHRLVLRRAAVVGGRLELEGEAYIRLLSGTTTIEVRRGPFGAFRPLPTRPVATPDLRDNAMRYPRAGFQVSVDVATLGKGTWAVRAVTQQGGVRRVATVRVPSGRGKGIIDRTSKGERAVLRVGRGRALRVLVDRRSPSPVDRIADLALVSVARARGLAGRLKRLFRRSDGRGAAAKRGSGRSRSRPGSGTR